MLVGQIGLMVHLRPAPVVAPSDEIDLLRLEASREAEGGEEVGVEEVVMPDDPIG